MQIWFEQKPGGGFAGSTGGQSFSRATPGSVAQKYAGGDVVEVVAAVVG
jgi:hypothetical protein